MFIEPRDTEPQVVLASGLAFLFIGIVTTALGSRLGLLALLAGAWMTYRGLVTLYD